MKCALQWDQRIRIETLHEFKGVIPMRLPQFTAKASLTKTHQHYTLFPGSAAATGTVVPQFISGVALVGHQLVGYITYWSCSGGKCGLVTAIVGTIAANS